VVFTLAFLSFACLLGQFFIEVMLLLTPYTAFFGLTLNCRFLFLAASAHLVFGLTLGYYCDRRLAA
jgi:hypothetical protein